MQAHKYAPIAFEKQLTVVPTPLRVMDKKIVVWRNYKTLVVQSDRCPHRGAKMSGGSVVGNTLECPYHGWRFDASGKCTFIPQKHGKSKIPKACNIETFDSIVHNGVLWAALDPPTAASPDIVAQHPTSFSPLTPAMKDYTRSNDYLVTDYAFDAPFNYFFQIENLLDPAHLDFVHDGFQGSRARASPIHLKFKKINEREISGYFEFEHPDTPDLYIRFIKPYVVDVSVIDPTSRAVMRKNIIFVAPSTPSSSRVLFRDVAFKRMLTSNPFIQSHLNLLFHMLPNKVSEEHHQLLTSTFIDGIMDQDIRALTGQQDNVGSGKQNYLAGNFVMPCESDTLIREFRKWCASEQCHII